MFAARRITGSMRSDCPSPRVTVALRIAARTRRRIIV
jgi:hypothetical protein